jgi:hypothetical protein
MSGQKIFHSVEAQNVSTNNLKIGGGLVLAGMNVFSGTNIGKKIKVPCIPPGVIVAPFKPLEQATIVFPETNRDGQIMFISFTQDVGKVAFENGNFANQSSFTSAKAGDSITLFYNEPSNKWYKLAGGSSQPPPPKPTPPKPHPTPSPDQPTGPIQPTGSIPPTSS